MLLNNDCCIQPGRERVVMLAHEWLGTPYHTGAMVKGAGVDCLTLLAVVFAEAELVGKIDIPYYPGDWHLHRESERYMQGLLQYTHEVTSPLPGDIALWKFGRCFSHGAIVINWPVIIHAYVGRECMLEDASKAKWLSHIGEHSEDTGKVRPVKFFSIFP